MCLSSVGVRLGLICVTLYRYGQLSGMVEPVAGLFGAAAVMVGLVGWVHVQVGGCTCKFGPIDFL